MVSPDHQLSVFLERRASLESLSQVDLNLLLVLQIVVEEGSVTRAARRLSLSQSAVSHALGRLRAFIGDPLLIRTSSGMTPTPRAAGMIEHLHDGMAHLRAAVDSTTSVEAAAHTAEPAAPSSDPATCSSQAILVAADWIGSESLSSLATFLAKEVPSLLLRIERASSTAAVTAIAQGTADVALTDMRAADGLPCQWLLDDPYVVVTRASHPAFAPPSLAAYLDARHVTVTSRVSDRVDTELKRTGRRRKVALSMPTCADAVHVASTSDLVATVPRSAVTACRAAGSVQTHAPPFDLPAIRWALVWHERTESLPGYCALRRHIAAQMRDS